ncbi:MAG: magnesium transporter CorA family protein [Actinomycetota bacterium]
MIHVYRWDEHGVFTVDSSGKPTLPTRKDQWIWVDVVDEDIETVRQLGRTFNLDPAAVEESFIETNLPLVEEHLDDILVVLHGFSTGGERLSTPEIDVFIGSHFLITVRDGPRGSIEAIKERMTEEGGLPVSSPASLLGYMAFVAGRRYAPLILELERQADALEEMAIQGDPQTIVEIHALRRDVIYLRRALGPQFEAYEDLSESTHPAMDDDARQMFARVALQHQRSLAALEAGRALLNSVIETYRGAVADQTNEIVRVLTVFSAILLPLTLIAGLWGMNFVEIPGAELEWGFWGLVGLMAVLVVTVWVYFSRRGFIGAPRLRELPKSVGLGLYTIGSAPIRVVAGGIRSLGKTEDKS